MVSLSFNLIRYDHNHLSSSLETDKKPYIGRFAPSPSGPLHFGSLVTALGSYLQAKANQGLWRLRIEDIDPPREVAGATTNILHTLEQFGLYWDGEILYQSQRTTEYQAVLAWLRQQDLSYHCQCTRKEIRQNAPYPGIYDQHCKPLNLTHQGSAIRLNNRNPITYFEDILQGTVTTSHPDHYSDDFIIRRKDGLFAYQLAVVVDDIAQHISQVVRGSDLLTTSLHQLTLYKLFGYPPPSYIHLPVICTSPGKKLSKQNHAPAINVKNHIHLLIKALKYLHFNPPDELHYLHQEQILDWAIEHWKVLQIPRKKELIIAN